MNDHLIKFLVSGVYLILTSCFTFQLHGRTRQELVTHNARSIGSRSYLHFIRMFLECGRKLELIKVNTNRYEKNVYTQTAPLGELIPKPSCCESTVLPTLPCDCNRLFKLLFGFNTMFTLLLTLMTETRYLLNTQSNIEHIYELFLYL